MGQHCAETLQSNGFSDHIVCVLFFVVVGLQTHHPAQNVDFGAMGHVVRQEDWSQTVI